MGSIAKISGVALAPGVSRNRRLYTPELIAKAAKRMQERLADPDGLPIVMRTHHDAGDDSAKIVGRVVEVTIDGNKALRYKADLYDTRHGKDIATLVTSSSPALRSVSIHGYWIGDTKQVSYEGGTATTADDLEIDAIDFTATPGVDGALIDTKNGKATESGGVFRTPISEATEATVTLVEEGSGNAKFVKMVADERLRFGQISINEWRRDMGLPEEQISEAKYSADDMKSMLAKGHAIKNASGEPSYPIADISDLKKAIHAVGRGKSGHDAIRAHIMKRAGALGATDLIPDNWGAGGKMKESTPMRFSEIKEYWPDGPDGVAGFCIDAHSGPLSVTVRGCVPPDELKAAATAAMNAACMALGMMDPDDDADIDVGSEETTKTASPDDEMNNSGESAHDARVKDWLGVMEQWRTEVEAWRADVAAAKLLEGKTCEQVADEMTLPPEDHSHTHGMDGEAHTHAHRHDHTDESGDGYAHSHTHAHVHASSDGEAHEHGHNHVHTTSPSATAESDNQEELAMSETNQAAEAAPTQDSTELVLGAKIDMLADAMRVLIEMNTPKQAAEPQETTEKPAEEVLAETVTPKADIDVAALKESLAKELRTELRNELRSEFLEEKGLPPRRGYRMTENDEPQELSNAELFDKYRTEILLGSFAPTPAAGVQAS
jgi:hypothetical protein